MKLEEVIRLGLYYIDFETPDAPIAMNLLIDIREFLLHKDSKWYKEKFQEAYNYDTGETRSVSDAYYTTDGITYFVNEDMNITSCRLHDSDITCDFNPYLQDLSFFTKKRGKGEYTHEYINEIDHFFTYCFNRYLAKKEGFYARESGIRAIYKAILA